MPSMNKKHFPAAVVLFALIGLSLLTPLPWNKARSAGHGNSPAVQIGETDLRIRLGSPADSCKAREIDKLLQEAYEKGAFSGQVLYAENGKVLYNRCFGFSDVRRHRDSIRPYTAFQLASVSKPFTAVAVMQLYQDGKIDIRKPVKEYLPDFPFEEITVEHLLQHRSGLRNYIYVADRYWPDKKKPLSNRDITPLLKKYVNHLDFPPGSRFLYCNTNYAYLALIVEEISGLPFAEYFDKNIAQPLGMERTFVYDPANPLSDSVARGYSYSRRTGFYKRNPDFLDGVVGDKGLYSTAEDLYRFDQALYRDDFLPDSIRSLMFTPAVELSPGHDGDYGLGFRIKQDTSGHVIVFHNGWWKGYRSYFTHDYQRNRTLIWLNNRSDVTVNPYIEKIFEIAGSYYPEEARQEASYANKAESRMTDRNETYGSTE